MLKILTGEERWESPCALLLGGFDGLHLGHRALLDRAGRRGGQTGITTIFGGKGSALFTREEREFLFARAGISFCIELEFTDSFQNTTAEQFLQSLFARVRPELIVCGEDFRFGRGAYGTPALLERMAPCPVEIVRAVKFDFLPAESETARMRKISTSACKRYLERGELRLLNACFKTEDFYGSAYFVQGAVEHGRQEGRKYGFPTLNLSVPEGKLLPPDGVYGGLVSCSQGNYPSIINIGARPTFGISERKIEAHLMGFEGDLYGEEVRVYPTEYLRPIERFASSEELKRQLQRDKEKFCI